MRKAIAALVVVALAFGGWWIYASYVMRDRATRLAASVAEEILIPTDDELPAAAEVREAIQTRARELGAELVDLEVSREEIETRSEQPERRSNQLQMVLERLQKNRVGMNPTRMQSVSLRPQVSIVARKYAVHGEIVVQHGLWSHRQPLDVERVLRERLVQ